MKFTIPLKAISVNHAYGSAPPTPGKRFGRRYLTNDGKEFKEAVGWSVVGQGGRMNNDSGAQFTVSIIFCFKDNRRRDVDDYFKIFIDALSGVIWDDDVLIISICGTKIQGCKEDYIQLEVNKV